MSDLRVERALRQGPPDERTYHPQLHGSSFPDRARDRRAGIRHSRSVTNALRLMLTTIVLVAAGGVLWVGQQALVPVTASLAPFTPVAPSRGPSPSPTFDLLSQVRASGALRMAIRPDFPQVANTVFNTLEGFDIDVGSELARRLAVSPHPIQWSMAELGSAGGSDPWDLAMPSTVLTVDQAPLFVSSGPYYRWPVYLVVPKGSSATLPTDLGGLRICITAGSSAEMWLGGRLDASAGLAAAPPSAPMLTQAPSDWACLDALASGDVDALITSTLSDSDLVARPSLRTVGGPLYTEPRTIVAARAGPDPSALLAAIDDALGAMRSDGTLADLSRNRFGGRDLTTPSSS